MSKKETIESTTEELVSPILEEMNFYLYDVEYVKEGSDYYLRIYIDKEGGITINDCEAVSRRMNELLDEKDYIDDAYIFEVSSPGLGRKLTKDKHLKMSIGEEVELKLYKARDKQKEFEGILKNFDETSITLETSEGLEIFTRSEIADLRLTIDF
ncbi:MAG: ribosome maturation factor RimP [Lachnospiraceae bacterium]|nr:ribosome maturation factor RimP [Lachnospiraceae bacterium]